MVLFSCWFEPQVAAQPLSPAYIFVNSPFPLCRFSGLSVPLLPTVRLADTPAQDNSSEFPQTVTLQSLSHQRKKEMASGPSVPLLIFFLEISMECLLNIRYYNGDTPVDGATSLAALTEKL